jgi:hypothetical protein
LTVGLALLAASALPALVGCGGDKEPSDTTAKPPAAPKSAPTGATAKSTPGPITQTAPSRTTTSPEQGTGGAGDEEGNRAPALLTGRAGRIAPPVVRVPPYLAIRVELRSADGRKYALRFGRRTIQAGGHISSASASFPGLRPGKTLVGRPIGAGNPVRIEANAEPGP